MTFPTERSFFSVSFHWIASPKLKCECKWESISSQHHTLPAQWGAHCIYTEVDFASWIITTPHYTELGALGGIYHTSVHYTTLHCMALHCTTLHRAECIISHYSTLHCTGWVGYITLYDTALVGWVGQCHEETHPVPAALLSLVLPSSPFSPLSFFLIMISVGLVMARSTFLEKKFWRRFGLIFFIWVRAHSPSDGM